MASVPVTISQYLLMSSFTLLPVLVNQFVLLDQTRENGKSRNIDFNTGPVFDFIVVGAGTSGSVVANRLAKKFSVLLLEAGGTPFPLMSIPGLVSLFRSNPHYDWAHKTVPQTKSCKSLNNKQSLWAHGKALGGSTNLNYMAYIRGHYLDYDNWANITGDERWSYKNILKYFKKVENYGVQTKGKVSEKYFGKHGEVLVDSIPFRPIGKYFFGAAAELGYKIVEDINLPFGEAFGNYSFTVNHGRRWGAFAAFLKEPNSNLTIYKYSTATKVLLNASNLADGVEFEFGGKLFTAKAKNEIILSAGTIGSPKLLMLSGIGPKQHLASVGIPVKFDLPVGENLQDHIMAFVGPFTMNQKLTYVPDRDTQFQHVIELFQNGAGPLTATGIEATGLIQSSFAKNGQNDSQIWPDNQLILAVVSFPRDGPKLASRIFNLRPDVSEEYYEPVAGKDSFHIMSVLSRPLSRGNIRLASSDYRVPPLIDPKYLHHPQDSKIILEGVQKILKMEETEAFRKIGATLSPVPFPSCKHLKFKSDAYWNCYLEHFTATVYHPTGTCAMGKDNSGHTVVDSSLRILGIKNLRVIDASIMPEIVSTNPQAACLAIGELGAALIKKLWANQ